MQGQPTADYFNNIAAVAVVLMFTKVASHELRKGRGKGTGARVFVLHGIAVGAAIVAAAASVLATRDLSQAETYDLYGVAGWAVVIAAAALVVDMVADETSEHRSRAKGGTAAKVGVPTA